MKPKAPFGSRENKGIPYRFKGDDELFYKDYDSMSPDVKKAQAEALRRLRHGIQLYLASIGRRGGTVGGKATTPAKRKAARENGKLGGRPKGKKNKP